MSFKFEIEHQDKKTLARVGKISTNRGDIITPVFMPVATRGVVKTLTPEELEEIGARIVLGNTYHLYMRPGLDVISKLGGLHQFMHWEKPILTDSGGYQVFSLSGTRTVTNDGVEFQSVYDGAKQFLSPEKAIEIQQVLGSEIIMVLDECPPYPASQQQVHEAVIRSWEWAERSKKSFTGKDQVMFGIVQGGVYPDLRRLSAEKTVGIGFHGYGIGGFSVGEPHEMMFGALGETVACLPGDKPRYLMGVGNPASLLKSIKQGIDMFDCALPTRMARNGTVFTSNGRLNIRNSQYKLDEQPLDLACGCYVCRNYSRSYLRHLFSLGEILAHRLLTMHSLSYIFDLITEAQEAIRNDCFDEFEVNITKGLDSEETIPSP